MEKLDDEASADEKTGQERRRNKDGIRKEQNENEGGGRGRMGRNMEGN